MVRSFITGNYRRLDQMTRSLVAFSRWSLTPGTLLLETIRASDCGRPRRVVAQTTDRPRQVPLYTHVYSQLLFYLSHASVRIHTYICSSHMYVLHSAHRHIGHYNQTRKHVMNCSLQRQILMQTKHFKSIFTTADIPITHVA